MLSQMNPVDIFSPYLPNISSNIILPSTLGLLSGLFPSSLLITILNDSLITLAYYMPSPFHRFSFDDRNNIC